MVAQSFANVAASEVSIYQQGLKYTQKKGKLKVMVLRTKLQTYPSDNHNPLYVMALI